jgi:hypothetical protein
MSLRTLWQAIQGPSGGLSYHVLAWKYRKTLWQPFRNEVQTWLSLWNPPERELILMGASGGYALPVEFLKRFEKIYYVDPDPIARLIFKWRFRGLKIKALRSHPQNLLSPIAKYPKAAVLFCNLLGQLPLILRDAEFRQLQSRFEKDLTERSWASFHDIVSTSSSAPFQKPQSLKPQRHLNLGAVMMTALLPPRSEKLSLVDHETFWLSEKYSTDLTWWSLRPNSYHLIGFLNNSQNR